jgi:hypothetical protein
MAEGKGIANKLIAYAFTIGIVIAIVLGLLSALMGTGLSAGMKALLTSILILAGIVVGFFNITPSETKDYILYVTAMYVVVYFGGATLGKLAYIGVYLSGILDALLAFILPSLIIVAIKAIINLAKN